MIIIPGILQIYSTDEWGAVPARAGTTIRNYSSKGIIFHHMDSLNRPLLEERGVVAVAKAFSIAKGCQQDHFANGWIDTGQHFTVTRDGVILEGRHGSISTACSKRSIVLGAHCADIDNHVDCNDYWGIENEGTYVVAKMPDVQLESLTTLMAWLCCCSDLDSSCPEAHRATGCSTECPGDWLFSQTSVIHAKVREKKLAFMKIPSFLGK